MSGLLRRLTRRGPATADENRSPTAESSEPTAAPDAPAEPGGDPAVSGAPADAAGDRPGSAAPADAGDGPEVAPDEQKTQVLPATGEQAATPADRPAEGAQQPSPGAAWAKGATADQPTAFAAQPAPARDLPAGVDPGDLSTGAPASARRGKLRRRLRYLRHVRELLLRDLGGFTYEVHRTAGGAAQESHRRLSEAKANRISALDAEVVAIEARLGEPHADTVLREPGIGGTCPECGELHASDARFCSRCGAPLDAKARAQRDATIAAAAEPHPTPEPQPASVLWAGGPRPSAPEEPEKETRPAAVTSQWLIGRDQPTTYDRAARPDEPAPGEPAPKAADDPQAAAMADPTGAAAHEPTVAETAAGEPTGAAQDPAVAADEPKAGADEPPAGADEPKAGADEPPAGDESETPAAPGESAAVADEPAPAKAAKPKRRASRRKSEPEAAGDQPDKAFEPGPNGRHDEDVPPPVSSGDPLARREQGS